MFLALARIPNPPRPIFAAAVRKGCPRGVSRRDVHPPFRDVRARRRFRDPGRENAAPSARFPTLRRRPNTAATSVCRGCCGGDRQGGAELPFGDVLRARRAARLYL